MSWQIVQLNDVAVLDRQSIHPTEAAPETCYVGLEHVDGEGAVDITQTVASAELKSNKFLFTEQHLLFGKLRPYLRKIARPLFSGVCSTDIIPILPKDTLSRDYLFHLLRTPEMVDLATSRSSGANLPRLSPKQLSEFSIPLPPLAEQKRIAAILDAADTLRAKRREAIAQLDSFLQSTFIDMFGDPVRNEKGWEVFCIGDVANIGTGSTPSRKFPHYFSGDIPWVKSTEVDWGEITQTSECVSDEGRNEAHLKLYPKGSVILALYGQGKTRGKCAILGMDAAINQACCAMTPKQNCLSPFLFSFLKFSYLQLRSESRGGNQENLNMAIVRAFPIPLPPLPLQHRFATIVESVERQKAQMRMHLAELDALFAALQARAFNGEL
jgi:type I restriction enzyme, S subunit